MRFVAVVLFVPVLGLGLEQSFSDTVFPPLGWTTVNADSGIREWQRLNIGYRTEPGCAYCGWENAFLRNFDWLVTPQCSVITGDSFSFWSRAQDDSYRESLEVWISTTSPGIPDFEFLDAFGTSSISYEHRSYDLSGYVDQRVFLGLVYRSLNQYGLMIDDVSGPEEWNPIHDVGISSIVTPGRFLRLGTVVRASSWVHNWAQVSEWVRVSCEVIGMWRDETGVELAPGESSLVVFPEIRFWQPGSLEVVFATHLGPDQCRWNDSLAIEVQVYPFQSRGGPDSLNYVWFDSSDPLGPAYEWQELYTNGTLLGWGDDSLLFLNLEWPFEFYGHEYSFLFVCTNGWMAFGPPAPGYPADSNLAIPNPFNPNRLVAPFWDDLWVGGNEGGIWYEFFGDSLLVIEWHKTRRKGCEECGLNFEVKLFRSGSIEFHYAGVNIGDTRYDGGMSATVGIEGPSGHVGLQYLYDGSPPGNLLCSGRAIRFKPLPPGIEGRFSCNFGWHLSVSPNPAHGNALIRYDVPHAASIRLRVYDLTGQKVRTLVSGQRKPGRYQVALNLSVTGIYFVRLETPGRIISKKIILSR